MEWSAQHRTLEQYLHISLQIVLLCPLLVHLVKGVPLSILRLNIFTPQLSCSGGTVVVSCCVGSSQLSPGLAKYLWCLILNKLEDVLLKRSNFSESIGVYFKLIVRMKSIIL